MNFLNQFKIWLLPYQIDSVNKSYFSRDDVKLVTVTIVTLMVPFPWVPLQVHDVKNGTDDIYAINTRKTINRKQLQSTYQSLCS